MNIDVKNITEKITDNMKKVIIGKDDVLAKGIICMLSEGHLLLEDMPGTGKTTFAKAFARSLGCDFSRIQFTPDLLPSDVTGINFYDRKSDCFVFRKGPVFTNILLADEINRATPKTQSSLLECMEEKQTTVDGETYPLAGPFLVVATQNPIETQGTYPLPEAQLDRFFMRLSLGYPDLEHEKAILASRALADPLATLEAVVTKEEVLAAQAAVRQISVSDAILQYIVAIVNATRTHKNIRLGASPRSAVALMRAAQACAAINGRDYVLPDDVKAICTNVLAHRIIAKGVNILKEQDGNEQILRSILDEVSVPV